MVGSEGWLKYQKRGVETCRAANTLAMADIEALRAYFHGSGICRLLRRNEHLQAPKAACHQRVGAAFGSE